VMNDALTLPVGWPGMATDQTESESNGKPDMLSFLRDVMQRQASIVLGRTATARVRASEEFATPSETATALSGLSGETGQPISMEEACAVALKVAEDAEHRRLAFFEKEARVGMIWEDEE